MFVTTLLLSTKTYRSIRTVLSYLIYGSALLIFVGVLLALRFPQVGKLFELLVLPVTG